MARIFITGSSEGLGRMAGELLLEQGHTVVLHARNAQRADATRAAVPNAEAVLVADLGSLREMHHLAEQANRLEPFDAVIHNVAVGYKEPARITTEDGLAHVFAVNTLAPYVLTARMTRPKRLVYLSSMLHRNGDPSLDDLNWERRRWNGTQAYSDTKLHDLLLALAVARLWPEVRSNAVEPGWVPTRMGGKRASDDLDQGHRTQVWLAAGDTPAVGTGGYFYHLQPRAPLPAAQDAGLQDKLLELCHSISGVNLQ